MNGFRRILWITISTAFVLHPALAQKRTPWTTSKLQGTPVPPPAYRVQRAFEDHSFVNPTSISELPTGREMLVTQMNGSILTVPFAGGEAHRVIDLSELAGGQVSLFSAALHPEFATNGWLFTCAVNPEGGRHTRVSRFNTNRTADGNLVADGSSEQIVLTWPAGGHNAGCLRFGPDGMLYVSTGDGAGPNPPDSLTTGQTVDDLLGALLRIDVNQTSRELSYAVPADNPFVGMDNARPEIFAYGLRNPWKFGIDQQTGDVFVADNGWETWEMIHHVRSGQNCGWPVMEGRAKLRTEVPVGPTPIVPPARDHHHSEANSVIGGPVYRGNKLPELQNYFVYGDYITGTIWGVKRDGESYVFADIVDTDLRIVDFTQTKDGALYVLDYDFTGGIYEVIPNEAEDLSAEFPRQLSKTGLFSNLSELKAAEGVAAYQVMAPQWQDGAAALRWVAVPDNASISGLGSAEPIYPDGTVLVRHLIIPSQPPVPLETQILHYDNGVWNPYSYLWNDAGTDASLVPPEGSTRVVTFPGQSPITWKAGATNECRLCHNAGSGFVLGFQPNQLQQKDSYVGNHYAALQRYGILKQAAAPKQSLALVDPHDLSQPLNDRARSYLHANCSSCHHKGGNAIVSFYLKRDLPFEEMNTNKGTGIGTFGIQNAKIIAPGDPYRSVLLYRMSKLGYARMPYIGSQVVDSAGVALIADWIQSLDDDQQQEPSGPFAAGSPQADTLQKLQLATPDVQRKAAIERLIETTEGALAVTARLHGGTVPLSDREWAIAATAQSSSDIRGLFDTFVPEAARRKTLGMTIEANEVLAVAGDARRGKLVYFTNNQRCRLCHDVNNPEKSIGPTLTEISGKYKSEDEILLHVLKPSLKVDDRFAAWAVATTSGQVYQGMRVPAGNGIALKNYQGETRNIPEEDIEEVAKLKVSFMPEGVLTGLTAQEAADLLAFIHSLKKSANNSPDSPN